MRKKAANFTNPVFEALAAKGNMELVEVIASINSFDDEDTIFAEKIDGKFDPALQTVVFEMNDDELQLSTAEVCESRCPGKFYFLEVFLVKEFIEDWATNHKGCIPTNSEACQSLMYYAENDSYPDEFFS